MDIHKNARLSFRSREALARFVVEQGATRKAAAAAFRVGAKTAGKWVVRYLTSGTNGLLDPFGNSLRIRTNRPRAVCLQEVTEPRRIDLPVFLTAFPSP
jgi:transposase